jgi:hypothetical protein
MFMPEPGSEFFPSWIRVKEFKYFNSKNCFLSSRKYVQDSDFLLIPDPGVKKAPDPRSLIRIRNTDKIIIK